MEAIIDSIEPEEGWSDTAINDLLWFERDNIAEWLGFSDWDELENGKDEGEEEEEFNANAEGMEFLNYCVGEELKFQTYCDKARCLTCPFCCHAELQTDCERAYNNMLDGHNFDEAIALLNDKV